MTDLEKLRAKLKKLDLKAGLHTRGLDLEITFSLDDDDLDRIFKVMRGSGVVKKVKRELPLNLEVSWILHGNPIDGVKYQIGELQGEAALLKAGYEAVEEL